MPKPQTPFKPLDLSHPLGVGEHGAFSGLLNEVRDDISLMLGNRDAQWLNAVASLLFDLVWGTPSALSSLPKLPQAKLEKIGPPPVVQARGAVGALAMLEVSIDWKKLTPQTTRWERFCVMALLRLRECYEALGTPGTDRASAAALDTAGAIAMEAMQALQLAAALRTDATIKSERAHRAAMARHQVFVPMKAAAVALAESRPFVTKEEALDHITSNLTRDKENKKFVSRGAAAKWLRSTGWTPEGSKDK